MEYLEFRAMNSDILLAAEGASRHVSSGFDQARAFIEASERRLSRFREDSELSRLNRSAGTWFQASEDLFDLVQSARLYYGQTGGLFNPAVLNALQQVGYDRSMDEIRARGAGPGSDGEHGVPDFSALRLDNARRSIFLPPGMQIDLGGIAKGWISERAARLMNLHTTACAVSAGGDMFMLGLPAGSAAWQVALEDPRDPHNTLAILNVAPGAVATSSVTKRRWRQGGQNRHHLIDPRTGLPAESRWLSVTVIAPRAVQAEIFAKTLLISGAADWESQLPTRNMVAIGVDHSGRLWGTGNSWEVLDVSEPITAG